MNEAMPTTTHEIPKSNERFRRAIRQILSVSKKELDRREAEYKKQRAKEKRPGKAGKA